MPLILSASTIVKGMLRKLPGCGQDVIGEFCRYCGDSTRDCQGLGATARVWKRGGGWEAEFWKADWAHCPSLGGVSAACLLRCLLTTDAQMRGCCVALRVEALPLSR